MPVTKQYLRYVAGQAFGVVTGRKGNAVLLEVGRGKSRQLRVVAPALEEVAIWDPRKGEKLASLRGGKREVSCLALSPDHCLLGAGYEDGSVRLWSVAGRDCLVTLSGHKSGVMCLQFDSSGTRLVSGSKDTDVIVWDVVNEAGLYRLRGHKGAVTACQFMATQNVLITSSKDSLVKLWDLDTQHCFQTVVGHRSEVWSLDILSGESRLVTGSGGGELRVFSLWQPESQDAIAGVKRRGEGLGGEGEGEKGPELKSPVVCREVGTIQRQKRERVLEVRSDPSGACLCVLSKGVGVEVFRVRSKEELERVRRKRERKERRRREREGHGEDEAVVVECGVEDELMLVHTLTSNTKAKIRSFDVLNRPNGDLLILLALQDNSLEVHTVTSSTPHTITQSLLHDITAHGHRTDIRSLCFNSDNTCVASGSSESVKVWRCPAHQCVLTIASRYALCLTFVPGDRHLLVGTKSGHLQLFELSSASLLEERKAHEGAVWSVGVAPDKRGVVTGSADHDVKFWEFELITDEENPSRRRLSLCHIRTLRMSEDVLCVRYSRDQRLLAVALLDCTVKVFFADTLKFFLSLYGHKLPVLSMDISTDGTLLATCSADKNIKLWGLDFGDCHKSIFAHDDSIMAIKFVPNTHLLFTASKDRTVKCWDADNFEHVMTLEGHQSEVWCLSISSDGDTVVTGSHDFSLRLWEKTQEPLVLSEERENAREAQFEEAIAEGGEPVVPGEGQSEVVMAGKKTVDTMKAAERIMEAVEVYREERAKLEEHEEECKRAGKQLPRPQAHPIIIAMGNPQPERYVLDVVKKVKSSELEESLLVMPFSEVTDFLHLLNLWIKSGWEVELSCRCLLFLLRVHHHQIVSSHSLLPTMDSLRQHTTQQVDGLRDLYGFNLAGLHYLRRELEVAGTRVFGGAPERLKQIKKKRRQRKPQS